MPLRIWLPLNNSYENRGIDGASVTTGGVFETPGKLSAYCWQSSARISVPYTYGSTERLSVCMWIKPNSAGAWTSIFGWGNTSTRANRIEVNANAGTTYYFFGSNDCLVNSNLIVAKNFTNAVWHHFAMVADGTNVRFYLDGALSKTVTQKSQVSATFDGTNTFYFGGYSDNYNGYYNDVRVYDHALSQKEVAELAKGMMIHYTLDNPYTTGIYNFYSGTNARGNPAKSSFAVTKLANEDGYNYKLTRTGTTSNYYPNIRFPAVSRASITAGKKYTWSAKIRVHTWTAGTFTLRSAIAANDYTNGGVRAADTSLVDNQWRQISRTITLTEGMKIGSKFYYITDTAYNESTESSKGYMAPLVEFYTSNQNSEGTTYDMDFDLKEVQLIESDSFPGWVDNSMASNTVRDNTGRGNDATCSGSVTTATGSPRNLRAFQFTSGACLWPIPDPIKSTTTEFTISVWFKTTTTSGNQCIWNGRTTTGAAVAIFLVGRGIRVDDSNQTTSVSVSTNTWYHLAVTWKSGGNKVIYLNGEQKTSVAAGTLSKSNANASIGRSSSGDSLSSANYFSGQMSDFRIYATALTAAQIKELYNAPISVANTGACLSGQFTEGASSISFAKTGVVSCNGISSLPGKYDPEVLIEPDGSCWAHIGHHADPTTYKFASGDPFATGVWKDDRRFLDASYCDLVDKWEFLIVQKADASATTYRYRWSQTKNPNTAAFADVAAATITKKGAADGYTDISSTYGGIYKKNSNTYYSANSGSSSSWWGAIGSWSEHQGGIPAYNDVVVKDGGYLDLYIRIDNVTFSSGRTGCSLDNGGKGVLSAEFVEQ